MRITLVTYSTRLRGSVVHTLSLAAALARAGEEVTVVGAGRHGDRQFQRDPGSGVQTVVVPVPEAEGEEVGARVLRTVAALTPAVAATGAEVVHAQDCIAANAWPGAVRTVHHLDTFTTPELVACHERALRNPVAHVCVSVGVAAELAAGWGIAATVIPNGVDAARFAAAAGDAPSAVAARALWRRRIGHPYVLAVGGIEPRKGSLQLVAAMAALRRSRPDVALVVAGGATLWDYRAYRAEFDRLAEQYGVEPLVLGPVTDDDLPPLVAAADVFAFPSTKEGFGLAAMEAAAAGVAVVARDLPVLQEVFGDVPLWSDGSTVSLADALTRALDVADRGRLERGRALAAGYTWDIAAAAHVELYRRLLDGRPTGAG